MELTEKLLCLFKERTAHGADAVIAQFAEFGEFGLLLGIEPGWYLDDDADMEVAVAVALNVFYALAAQPQNRPGLCPGGDVDTGFAAQCGDFNFGTKRGLHETDWHFAKEVVSVTLENLVIPDVKNTVKVTGFTSADACFAVAGRAKSSAGIDSSRNANRYLAGFVCTPLAVATAAWLVDGAAGSLTTWAGLRDAEKPL